jgi:hypothetical protein
MSGSSGPISRSLAMLPDAYQLNESNIMSAIFEDNSDLACHIQGHGGSDIMVSDCGYYTPKEDCVDPFLINFLKLFRRLCAWVH